MLKPQQTQFRSEKRIKAIALDFEKYSMVKQQYSVMLLLTPVSSLTSLIAAVQISSPCKWNSN